MSRYLTWLRKYNGKPVAVDLEERALQDADFDYVPYEDRPSFGIVDTNLRPYKPMSIYDSDNWSLCTGISFHVDKEGRLCDIAITANVLGDDGLGDVDLEDVWNMDDYRAAKEFLDNITASF